MGKGDRRTAKGKRYSSSYGNSRPHGASATAIKAPVVTKAPAAAAKKTAAKKKA
jgi:30S ribosomal protein S31